VRKDEFGFFCAHPPEIFFQFEFGKPSADQRQGKQMHFSGGIRNKCKTIVLSIATLLIFAATIHAQVEASLNTINFGNQSVGTTSASRTLTLNNLNWGSVEIMSASISSTPGSGFSYSGSSLPVHIAGRGGSLTFAVRFNPSVAQTYSGVLVLKQNNDSVIRIILTGVGTQAAGSEVAPSITSQPANQTVVAGNAASFTVSAAGTAPLAYQWSKNGAAISGATSSKYTTPAETAADNNAQFTVVVSNSAGSVKSGAAILAVDAPTRLLNPSSSSLSFGSVNVSTDVAKTVTLTNAGNSSVTISNVTISGAGFNAAGVSSGTILAPGQAATLTATFAPAGTGSVTGSVSVASTATNSPDTISLSGTGVTAASHSVLLSWSPSVSSVVGYNAYVSLQSGGPFTKMNSTPVGATSYTDTAVQAGQTYYFVITSINSNNEESARSAEVSALVP
jgi:hypothetical protein